MTGLVFVVAAPLGLFLAGLAAVNHRHQIPEVTHELHEWWRRRHNPHRVAGANVTVLDEETWANPLSTEQLHRRWRRYERLKVKGKLRGEHLVRAIAVRKVLIRRIKSDAATSEYMAKRSSR